MATQSQLFALSLGLVQGALGRSTRSFSTPVHLLSSLWWCVCSAVMTFTFMSETQKAGGVYWSSSLIRWRQSTVGDKPKLPLWVGLVGFFVKDLRHINVEQSSFCFTTQLPMDMYIMSKWPNPHVNFIWYIVFQVTFVLSLQLSHFFLHNFKHWGVELSLTVRNPSDGTLECPLSPWLVLKKTLVGLSFCLLKVVSVFHVLHGGFGTPKPFTWTIYLITPPPNLLTLPQHLFTQHRNLLDLPQSPKPFHPT